MDITFPTSATFLNASARAIFASVEHDVYTSHGGHSNMRC
jgi:hypothetical protein